jgi:hypothetical protein
MDIPRIRLSGFFERLLTSRSLSAAPAAAPASAVAPAIRGVLALDAVSATARPEALVLSSAVAVIEPAPVSLCTVERGRGRALVVVVRLRAVLVRLARLPFAPLRFELDVFRAAVLLELAAFARAPFAPLRFELDGLRVEALLVAGFAWPRSTRLVALFLVDFVLCAISLLVVRLFI